MATLGAFSSNVLLFEGDRVMVNGQWISAEEMRRGAGESRWITVGEALRDMHLAYHLRRGILYARGLAPLPRPAEPPCPTA